MIAPELMNIQLERICFDVPSLKPDSLQEGKNVRSEEDKLSSSHL